jgi:hypothetical protein
MKTGDILYSSWGYDQTNIDFYEVMKATAKTVTVRQIESSKKRSGFMSGTATPIQGAYVERRGEIKELRRKVNNFWNREFISITDYASAYLYEGKPLVFSEYA